MSVESYLLKRSSNAILSNSEESSITTSISTLSIRLRLYFQAQLQKHFKFGSSTRGTILPRSMDANSDIDYIIVFKEYIYKPQTYIDKLKLFANTYYSTSNIAQSHPTVVLELNHIKFDLVPAIKSYSAEYKIPASNSSFTAWQHTSPNSFNNKLTSANKRADFKLKPAIRLLKYWNANAGYVFESYLLETFAAEQHFFQGTGVKDYLFFLIDRLQLDWSVAQWRKDKLNSAKKIIENIRLYESQDMLDKAESEIKKLIPV